MKNLLIIYPHWPPSNLAGVHRARLISNFLRDFDWHPIVLTVEESHYEEVLDNDLIQTVRPDTEVVKTSALPVMSIFGKRIIGDIGLRSFFKLWKSAVAICESRKIEFIWIPIPSFYTSILGRLLNRRYEIKYGIDYIDPWVRPLASFQKPLSRSWWSLQVAKILEPIAVKNASLISGVSESYFEPVLKRNFNGRKIATVGMPYGFDPRDHEIEMKDIQFPWEKEKDIVPIVYAGAFLPKSRYFIQILFEVLGELRRNGMWPRNAKFYFLGTGNYQSKTIQQYAEDAGVGDLVIEIRSRFPFLHVQAFLRNARGTMIIGSTEKHYTASKTFQCILAKRPIFSILHKESSAVGVLKACAADRYVVKYTDQMPAVDLHDEIKERMTAFIQFNEEWQINAEPLDAFSAKVSTEQLVQAIESILH